MTLNNTTKVCLIKICDYINIIDILKLNQTSKEFRLKINMSFLLKIKLCNCIMRICKVNITQTYEFLKQIGKHNGVISGSILLEAIYGEKYENSDIDIFYNKYRTHGNQHCNEIKKIRKSIIKNVLKIDNIFHEEPYQEYLSKKFDPSVILADLTKNIETPEELGRRAQSVNSDFSLLYNHKTHEHTDYIYKNVQIIECNRQEIISDHYQITNCFDLSICMNTYSPKTKIFEVYNIQNLIKRKSINFSYENFKSSRVFKYINRNIEFFPSVTKYRSFDTYLEYLYRLGKLSCEVFEEKYI
jgi:hypothetical protein